MSISVFLLLPFISFLGTEISWICISIMFSLFTAHENNLNNDVSKTNAKVAQQSFVSFLYALTRRWSASLKLTVGIHFFQFLSPSMPSHCHCHTLEQRRRYPQASFLEQQFLCLVSSSIVGLHLEAPLTLNYPDSPNVRDVDLSLFLNLYVFSLRFLLPWLSGSLTWEPEGILLSSLFTDTKKKKKIIHQIKIFIS